MRFCYSMIIIFMSALAFITTAQEPSFFLIDNRPKGKSSYDDKNDTTKIFQRDEAKTIDPSQMKFGPATADAVAYALADIAAVPKGDQPFQRYIWIPDGSKMKMGEVNYTLNVAWSRATPLIKAKIAGQGRLARIDLRYLAPRAETDSKDYRELHSIWERMALDEPYFHITRTTGDSLPTNAKLLKSTDDDPTGSVRFTHEDQTWYRSSNGKTYCLVDGAWVAKRIEFPKKEKIAVAGAHVGLDTHVMLQGLTQSVNPVVRYDWWVVKSLTSLNGGLYYELLGVERKPVNGTALDAFFSKFGYDPKEVAKLRADQRVAMFKSKVTGRPRRVDFFRGQGVRPDSGTGLGTITFDPSEEQVAAENDPIRNLLEFKFAASEVILERANGMHAFGLFSDKGELQDSAPDNVVKDHTIPSPYQARLQSAISCIRCHGSSDGWQPAQNDVRLMLSGYLNVYDDLSAKSGNVPDTIDRLAGLYAGDLQKALRRGRDDYSDAIYMATGGQSVSQAAMNVSNTFSNYLYTDIDAYVACRELGYEVPPERAVYFLNLILPPLQRDAIGISPEDPCLAALKIGLRIQRYQWEAIYADAAFRAMQSRRLKESKK